ncbi:hypothetical protein HDU92_000598 [Lobulomyces angularis]|nr:hypothetical protein HDU92_000598 [Lobulomyces angularis]
MGDNDSVIDLCSDTDEDYVDLTKIKNLENNKDFPSQISSSPLKSSQISALGLNTLTMTNSNSHRTNFQQSETTKISEISIQNQISSFITQSNLQSEMNIIISSSDSDNDFDFQKVANNYYDETDLNGDHFTLFYNKKAVTPSTFQENCEITKKDNLSSENLTCKELLKAKKEEETKRKQLLKA